MYIAICWSEHLRDSVPLLGLGADGHISNQLRCINLRIEIKGSRFKMPRKQHVKDLIKFKYSNVFGSPDHNL
jgi:hypothetical protein